jgi:hypothetical protein
MAAFLKKMIEKAFSILFVEYAKETMSVFNGHPTRSTALLQFDSTVSVFFNQETHWDQSLTDPTDPVHIRDPTNIWSIERKLCDFITASLISQDPLENQWKMKLQFHDNEVPDPVATVRMFVPNGWLPRTMLVLLARSCIENEGVISVVTSLGAIDISGLLRITSGETVEDLHDCLQGTEYDAMVEGGGEF